MIPIGPKKIKTKLNLIFIALFMFSIVVIGLAMQTISARILSDQIYSHLETTARSRAKHVETILTVYEERAKLIASNLWLRNHLKSYIDTGDEEYKEEIKEIIKDVLIANPILERICVASLNGRVICSTEGEFEGKDISDKDFFIKGREGVYVSDFDEENGEPIIYISGPLILDEELIGLVIVVSRGEYITNTIQEYSGLGETGEAYLVNKDGYMITPSRFIGDTFLKLKVDTDNFRNCFEDYETYGVEEHEHEAAVFLNYQGVKTLGVHAHIPKMHWCLLAEINSKEALAPTLKILWAYLAVAAGLLALYLLLISWISGVITRPIKKLTETTKALSAGNYMARARIKSKDEIGSLSESVNKMADEILTAQSNLESKVGDRTKKLGEKKESLEKQQQAILNILEDVEEEKTKVSLEKDKINAILHSIGDAVFVVNTDLNITMYNQVAAEVSGFSIEEAINQPYEKILKFVYEKDGKTNNRFIKEAMRTGEIQEMANHTLLVRKDDTKVPVSDSAAPLKDRRGKIIGCVVVFRDVEKERAVDRMKTEFISLASHQLRTPLSAMKWFLEMLLGGDAGKLTKEQAEYITNIDQSNERMIDLVNALLNISRIESGRIIIAPEPTKLKSLVETVITELKPKLKEKKQNIVVSAHRSLPKVNLDPKLIRNVYQNLLTNAIKYSPEKSDITIMISKKGDNIVSQISDSGVGIPKKEQHKVFQKFFRGDNIVKMETDGNGLGLYLVKAVIESSGGKVWFESKEKKGSIFWFSLPIKGVKPKKGEVAIGS